MKRFEKIMYPLLVIFLFIAIYVARTNLYYFETTMAAEDGFFQWATCYTLLFASAMCFYRASILKPFRGGLFSFFLIITGCLFFIFALDEVSWFQRIIGFQSFDFFKNHNTQKQVNFHHLVLYGFHLNTLIFTLVIKILATIYFLILPFIYNKIEKIKTFFNRFAIPIPRYTHTGAYLLLAGFTLLIPSDFRFVIFEFGFYWIFVLMMYNPLNDEIFSRISLIR